MSPSDKPSAVQDAQRDSQSNNPKAFRKKSGLKNRKKLLITLVASIVALLIIAAVALAIFKSNSSATIDSGRMQAVFFTNGQVYFGKLSIVNRDYMRLSNVFYLQTKSDEKDDTKLQSTSKEDATGVELIKLGNEIHGPTDEMLINRDQVLFFENLKPDGSVSQTIKNYQTNQNK